MSHTFEFKHPDIEVIIREVAEYFNLTIAEVTGKRRNRPFIIARHTCFYLIKKLIYNTSLEHIGARFNADHSTVIHGLTNVDNWIDTDHVYTCKLYDLRLILSQLISAQMIAEEVSEEDFKQEIAYLEYLPNIRLSIEDKIELQKSTVKKLGNI